MEKINLLRQAGFLPDGQIFGAEYINSTGAKSSVPDKIDWTYKVDPTGKDLVQCVEEDEATCKVIRSPAINRYSHQEEKPMEMPYYVYEVEARVDSSD
jgi:hypothetical protein